MFKKFLVYFVLFSLFLWLGFIFIVKILPISSPISTNTYEKSVKASVNIDNTSSKSSGQVASLNNQKQILEKRQEKEEFLPTSSKIQEDSSMAYLGQGQIICIDPGHQAQQDLEVETISPSSSETKAKVSSGTQGVISGKAEYQWYLEFSFLLKELLTEAGYQVILTRESHQINLSNQERAQLASNCGADIYLRIHANASSNPSIEGLESYYVSPKNIDAGSYSSESKRLSELIIQEASSYSGAINRGAKARDDLTGSNFAQLPTSLLELGYMSHPQEDQKLNDPAYQEKLAYGILQGVNKYFQGLEK